MEMFNLEEFKKFAIDKFKNGYDIKEIPKLYESKVCKQKKKSLAINYTPIYIAEYIIENTLRDIKEPINKITICDPACGCGTFLLIAFDYIKNSLEQQQNRQLSFREKEEIIEKQLYGVDLDWDACEITKLLLSMKLYEDYRDEF